MHDPVTRLPDEDETLPAMVSRLVGETRSLASAEVAVYKARIGETIVRYRTAAVFFVVAGVLALAALIALLVGLILTLTPYVGAGFATLIVVGVVLAIAVILGLVGKSRLSAGEALS